MKTLKYGLSNKGVSTFWAISSLVMLVYFIAFYSTVPILGRLLLGIAASANILSVAVYRVRANISVQMLFINQLALFGVSLITQSSNEANTLTGINHITPEFLISIVGLFSIAYISIKSLKSSGERINIQNISKLSIKPFKLPALQNILIVSLMVSAILTLSTQLRLIVNYDTLLPATMVVLPSLIMLITIVPIELAQYIRVLYYLLWIYVIRMMIVVDGYGTTNLLEPLTYLITVVVGNAYRRWDDNNSNKGD